MPSGYDFDLQLDGKVYNIPVVFEKKKRKTLVLKIQHQKKVVIFSVPTNTPKDFADKFFYKNKKWLEDSLKKILPELKEHDYQSGDEFYYLGSKLPLEVITSSKNQAYIKNGKIIIEEKSVLSSEDRKKLLEKMFLKEFKFILEESFSYVSKMYLKHLGVLQPEIKIRKMIGKWGVCRPLKNQITINSHLVHLKPELIDYVVAHELCHFKHANHGKEFWLLLGQEMPDWRDLRKQINDMGKYIGI